MENNSILHPFKITAVIKETEDAKTFVLQPAGETMQRYEAGQFITVVFNTPFGEKRRSYSISSAPLLHEPLQVTIKKVDNGEFSRQMVAHFKTGDTLQTIGITGFFTLPKDTEKIEQYFFLAAGSGITPCYALIKTLLATSNKMVNLVYSNRSEADTIFYSALQALQTQYPTRFTCLFLFSSYKSVHQNRLSKWLLQSILQKQLATEKPKALFYLCGPFSYMQMATITLLSEGIPAQNIRKENFDSLPRLYKPEPPDTAAHQVSITINGSEYNITVQYPQSILAAAKEKNITLPYSCEAGRCGSCAATCTKGKIWMAYNEVLMDDEINKGRVLTCQGYPVGGDVVLSF